MHESADQSWASYKPPREVIELERTLAKETSHWLNRYLAKAGSLQQHCQAIWGKSKIVVRCLVHPPLNWRLKNERPARAQNPGTFSQEQSWFPQMLQYGDRHNNICDLPCDWKRLVEIHHNICIDLMEAFRPIHREVAVAQGFKVSAVWRFACTEVIYNPPTIVTGSLSSVHLL